MKNKLYILSITCLGLMTATTMLAKDKGCKTHGPGEDIYKHYTGTIGTKKITLDLRYGYCGSSNYGGSYFYEQGSKDVKRIVISQPATFDHNTTFLATEYETDHDWSRPKELPAATWEIKIKDDKLTGKWRSVDKKETREIKLTEDYKTAYQLDVFTFEDSSKASIEGQPVSAQSFFIGVRPNPLAVNAETDFIKIQLVQLLNEKAPGISNWAEMPIALAHQQFTAFRMDCEAINNDGAEKKTKINHDKGDYNTFVFPLYNENGLLGIESESMNFGLTGDRHDHSYVNVDVPNKKIWHLKDIIGDSVRVYLNAVKTEFMNRQKPEFPSVLTPEKIVPTEHFIIMQNGLLICCRTDIDNGFPNEVRFLVPYTKLKSILTKEFKTRMKL